MLRTTINLESKPTRFLSPIISRCCVCHGVCAGLHFTYPGDKRRAARDELSLLGGSASGDAPGVMGLPRNASLPRSTSCGSAAPSASEESSPFLGKHRRNHMI
jgi:hypothetical protein